MCIVCSEHEERGRAEHDCDWGRVRDAEVRISFQGCFGVLNVISVCWCVCRALSACVGTEDFILFFIGCVVFSLLILCVCLVSCVLYCCSVCDLYPMM